MSNQKELDDLRSAIVSQLATRKPSFGIPLEAVNKDYHEFNDEYIPYHKFGFATLVDFLRTIPEIELYYSSGRSLINFKGKESFKHVTDLVAKTPIKFSRNYKGSRSRSAVMRKTIPPGYRPPQDYIHNKLVESSSSSSSTGNEALKIILSVIKENPGGLTQAQLIQKLYNTPYTNLNNNQVQEHLKMLDKEITIKDNLIYLGNSSPQETFAQQPNRSQSAPRRYNQDKYSDDDGGPWMVEHTQKYDNPDYYNKADNNYGQYLNNSQNSLPKSYKISGLESDDGADDVYQDLDGDFDSGPSLTNGGFTGYRVLQEDITPDYQPVGNNSREPEVVTGDSRPADKNYNSYNSGSTKNVNFSQHNSSYNAAEFDGHNNGCQASGSNYNYKYKATNNTSGGAGTKAPTTGAGPIDKEAMFQQKQKRLEESISQRTVLRLQKLLENNPNGIWCLELVDLYEKEYKLRLEWESHGFQRLSDFIAHLPKVFLVVGPFRRGDYRLFDARKPIPDDIYDSKFQSKHQKQTTASHYEIYANLEEEECLPRHISSDLKRLLVPDDALSLNETVGLISVSEFGPRILDNGEKKCLSLEAHVVEAFDPSFFWIQLTKNKAKFEEMMEDLGAFYLQNSEKYVVPRLALERGLNVACKFHGVWHRGIVKSFSPSQANAKILFYDFGTLKSYRTEELFFLNRKFGRLPAQAIPCGLASIKPKEREGENGWSKQSRNLFINLAFKCEMWATVMKINLDNNFMLVGLTDTSGVEDIHLADYLVLNKFAEKSNTELAVDPNNLSLYIEDYGDGMTPYVPETEYPELLSSNILPSSSIAMSSASPSIQNLSNILNTSLASNIPTALRWESAKDKIIEVLNDYTQSTMKLYESMLSAERESMTGEIIKSTLYDAYAKLFYQAILVQNLNDTLAQTFTPNQSICGNLSSTLMVQNQNLLQYMKDHSLSELQSNPDSDTTLTNEKSDATFGESLNNYHIATESKSADFFTQLEAISNAFVTKLPEKKTSMQFFGASTSDLVDTNPFKQDLMSAESREMKIPPPLPPRPQRNVVEPETPEVAPNSAVFSAPPAQYDSSENSSSELKNKNQTEKLGKKQKKSTPSEGFEEDSWDLLCSQHDQGDATSAESIDKDSSQAYNYCDNNFESSNQIQQPVEDQPTDDLDLSTNNTAQSGPFDSMTVELSNGPVFIYSFDKKGWMLVDQFRLAFTVYDDNKFIITMMEMKNVSIPVKVVTIAEYPEIFEHYFSYSESSKDNENLSVLELLPIMDVLKLSQKLGVVTKEEIESFKNKYVDYQPSEPMIDILRLYSKNEQFTNEYGHLRHPTN